jgi:cation diffusion facilitator family transporter
VEIQKRNQANIRLQLITVIIGALLLVIKFWAYFLTNSNAILTDALESIVNVLAGAFGLFSLFLAAQPSDKNHPYGHGKIEFISASIEGSLIVLAGSIIIVKSVYNFFIPNVLHELGIGIILSLAAGLINYVLGYVTESKGKKTNSLTLVAGGKHLKSDAYSTLGLFVGLIIIYFTNLAWLDNIAAIIFGAIICFTGYKIVRKSVAGIMDEADYELIKNLIDVLNKNRRPNWIDIHNLRVIKYGSTLHIDCHLTLPWQLNVLEANNEVEEINRIVNLSFSDNVELFIHIDPSITQKENKTDWTLEGVIAEKNN